MKAQFTTINRKDLVKAIAEITESKPKYMGAPTFAYEIAEFRVNRDGTVESEEEYELKVLINALAAQSIYTDEAEQAKNRQDALITNLVFENFTKEEEPEETNLSISLPKDKFTPEVMTNFINLVAAKQELLKQALKTDDLSIIQEEDKVTFPWFAEMNADSTNAYMLLLTKMVEMATNQKRISAKAKEIVNPKYEFRCFLLRLGFIGEEYKGARKVLLKNLVGSAAFKKGVAE